MRLYHINIGKQLGLSLIELMVAMLMGTLVALFVANIHLNNRKSYQATEDLARLQENIRFASITIANEFRMVGYIGCAQSAPENLISMLSNPDYTQDFATAIQSFEANNSAPGDNVALSKLFTVSGTWTPEPPDFNMTNDNGEELSLVADSDIVIVRRAASETVSQVTNIEAGTITAPGILSALERTQHDPDSVILFASDCSKSIVFKPSYIADDSISYTTLGATLDKDSEIMAGNSTVYFIASTGPDQEPSLYQQLDNNAPSAIAQGIENMQIVYGVDNDNDGIANQYVTGDLLTADSNVATVRIGLIARSQKAHLPQATSKSYTLVGSTISTPDDRRIRQVTDLTIQLRNSRL